MSIVENFNLAPSPATTAVQQYLLAQESKSFANAVHFLAPEVDFNGLVLKTKGRESVVAAMDEFLPAIETLRLEAATQVASGDHARFLILYWFKLIPQAAEQPLCDHIVVENGLITRIDNVFDLGKMPAM